MSLTIKYKEVKISFTVGASNIEDKLFEKAETALKFALKNNRLKFPGRHKKYVSFEIYQEFCELYKDEIESKMPQEEIILHTQEPKEDIKLDEIDKNEESSEVDEADTKKKKSTDWLKLLTG